MVDKKLIVDPPSGWKYGFPCELKPGEDYATLLRNKGYPEKDIEFAIECSRSWYQETDIEDERIK